ncbi:hypothetical protein [Pseudomonas sp. OST1909]|uniref:hypothetical protein n=1 Tax=Pseudomonas sp. OST1909 TaxID=2777367 RepID=UPI001888EB39|nr:hypothetical protein [Pseudomonas sp. OST1909]QOY69745.1 hypothetical protein IH404_18305 [Pseudomonas sp. OST1909]
MAQAYLNDRTTDYLSLKSRLMGRALNQQRSDHFDVLNRHLLHKLVTPGQKVLGVSTKSYLHKGEIAGYAQRIGAVAQASKWLGNGTYVGLAMDVGVAGLEIREACVVGREAQCKRAKYVETGRLVGGVVGAAGAGGLGAELTRRACNIFLGVATRGTGALTCAIIGGAMAGYLGGKKGGDGGAFLGGKIVEDNGDLIFQPEGA